MARKIESAVIVGKPQRRRLSRRWLMVIFVCTILVAGGVLNGFMRHQQSLDKARNDAVTQAVNFLDPSYTPKLAAVVPQIKQQLGYDSDADCLYVLTTYYINISDNKNTKLYYDKLAAVYDPAKGYKNAQLRRVAQTPASLKPTVTFIENQAKEAARNTFGIPGVVN